MYQKYSHLTRLLRTPFLPINTPSLIKPHLVFTDLDDHFSTGGQFVGSCGQKQIGYVLMDNVQQL